MAVAGENAVLPARRLARRRLRKFKFGPEGRRFACYLIAIIMATPSVYNPTLWEEFAQVDVVDVVVDIDVPDLQSSYTYRVPEHLQNLLVSGVCVHVPFSGREALGYIVGRRRLDVHDPLCARLREVHALVEDAVTINGEQLDIVRWMCDRYVCDMLSAIRCVAPAQLAGQVGTAVRLADASLTAASLGAAPMSQAHVIETLRAMGGTAELRELREEANLYDFQTAYASLRKRGLLIETRTVRRARVVEKKIRVYGLGAAAEALGTRRSVPQQRILDTLLEAARQGEGPQPADVVLKRAGANAGSLRRLVEQGVVQVTEKSVRRAPVRSTGLRTTAPVLTPGQAAAARTLRAAISCRQPDTLLLFGVTASGKTEVYLDAIAHALAIGRTAIVLLPEIALTAQVVDIFTGRFGEQVAVLHSRLSEGERHDEWRRMQQGAARIAVGARSAIFAPLADVGLIVLDEEHEASYKQEKMPRYNAREVASERARISGAVLVLGSATPSLESFYASEPIVPNLHGSGLPGAGAFRRIEMRERIDNRPLPTVEVVDLREEFKQRRALFSVRLQEAIELRLRTGYQTILFLNRRGYAQFLLCRDCGYTARCPNCAVSLAFHAYNRTLRCHHCDHTSRSPQSCPDCGGLRIRAFGIGTEKVEEEVRNCFPSARVIRLDRDTTSRKGEHTRILRAFRQGESDVLIGTQMVAKGLDFPNVTLVGVVSADTGINMPDFRAAERTFQLLTQVAGRAGRGEMPGEVVIQTFSPGHYAVQAALSQDYVAFYKQELLFRRELRYPPYSRFANLICADPNEGIARGRAAAAAAAIQSVCPPEVEVIGPSPAPLARLKSQYRFHVALRAPVETPLSRVVRDALECLAPGERLGLSIDMDPLSMA